jgi:hypothetical protein
VAIPVALDGDEQFASMNDPRVDDHPA